MLIMYIKTKEGQANFFVPKEEKISKDLPVFYNKIMKLNRDISILLLNSLSFDNLKIGLPLEGTGIRGIRFFLELKKGKYSNIDMNDINLEAIKIMKLNISENYANINIFNLDANEFLLNSKGYDYIDIDPFGSPNPFLDSAIKRLSRCGILAVTATDTSSLSGTFENACLRKYWAKPSRTEIMHEVGLRILIRKVQLVASQYSRALMPIFSYSKDHYMRIFFKSKKGKKETDNILKQHSIVDFGEYKNIGPIWNGKLYDENLCQEMVRLNDNEKNIKFLETIYNESKFNSLFFYDLHTIVKKNKIKINPRKEDVINRIKEKGYNAVNTHFLDTAIKSDIPYDELLSIIKSYD
jgi:tRNA (guanine26-N2/guanine27-N2)-dimethyltransferase